MYCSKTTNETHFNDLKREQLDHWVSMVIFGLIDEFDRTEKSNDTQNHGATIIIVGPCEKQNKKNKMADKSLK